MTAMVMDTNRPVTARPWAAGVPVGLGDAATMVEPTWQELAAAVRDQEPMVRRQLVRQRGSCDVDLVMGEVASTAWLRLESWRELDPRPELAAYVNGIARNCVHEWRRGDMTKRPVAGGRVEVVGEDVADLPPGKAGPAARLDGSTVVEDQPDTLSEAAAALRVLQALVISRPGGTAAWQRIVSDALHDVRGQALRTEVRVFLDSQLEGRPMPLGPRLEQLVRGPSRPLIPTQRRAG